LHGLIAGANNECFAGKSVIVTGGAYFSSDKSIQIKLNEQKESSNLISLGSVKGRYLKK